MCQLCTSGFTFTHRRHHCRACGKVVCATCSSHRLPLPYLGSEKPVRICDDCFRSLQSGGEPRDHQEADGDGEQGQGRRKKPGGVLQEVAANDLGSSMSGYLHHWSKKAWKRQWFVIKEHVLYVYKASEDVAALRTVPLLGYQVGAVTKGFEEVPREQLFLLEHTGLDPLIFYADTSDLAARWREAMEEATKLS
uniref:Rho/rac guanine nucleotide exchange factor/faciogenital dysplasia protein 3 n=1 Tax=Rhipicephalus appendiculatus TaxID=34631 RepID=A0A131YTG5_RHIAP